MYTASDTPTTQLYSQLDPYKRTVSSQVELYPQKMDSKPQLYLLDKCIIASNELTDVSSAEMYPYKICIFSNSNVSLEVE